MLQKTHEITFTFFDVGGGDAIWIRFLGNDHKWHNVLIDGGYGNTYKKVFGPLINEIIKKEQIDLWIITHTDIDHIGSVLGFIQDKKIKDKKAAIKEFWFNHSPLNINKKTGKLGVSQGIKLRKYLEDNDLLVKQAISSDLSSTNLFGLTINILSPTKEKLLIAQEFWKEKERTTKLGRKVSVSDHKKTIEELKNENFTEDNDKWNGGSIACLIQFKGIKVVLLADSHPTSVLETLTRNRFKDNLPINVAFIQLSHHGSKANNSQAMLDIIETTTYVITGNGVTNQHPHKETLVRVLTKKTRKDKPFKFVFSSDTKALRTLFSVDKDPFTNYKFGCTYPSADDHFTSMKYLPLKEIFDE